MRRYLWPIVGAVAFLLLLFGGTLVTLITDWVWFKDLGYTSIFSRMIAIKIALFVVATSLFFIIIYFNLWLARRIAPLPTERLIYSDELRQRIGAYAQKGLGVLIAAGALVISVMVGLGATGHWNDVLMFLYGGKFGQTDPIFHRDVAFYVFTLPFLKYVYGWLFFALVAALIAVCALYYLGQAIEFLANIPRFAPRVKSHIFTLIALLFALRAWGYWLDRYGLLFSRGELISGAGYADIHARLPAMYILMVASLLAGILCLININRRGIWLAAGGLIGVVGLSLVVGSVYPTIVQNVIVKPNQSDKERPFIQNGIKMTRLAYGLTDVARRTFPAERTLTSEEIAANEATLQNVRLWDYQPLLRVYKQTQELQQYYEFHDVDIDRYTIDGQYRQVMLSARELQQANLADDAKQWVNLHLVYTHGYGPVMSPVNEVTSRGFPKLFISNMPAVSDVDLKLTQPALYFGELTDSYALVHSKQKEFDYPSGQENVYTRYAADKGVRIGSYLNKLMFAARLGDVNLLISPKVSSDTRLLFRRTLESRLTTLFPFLKFDQDPYLVILDGKMVWIQDAYTVTNQFPYSAEVSNRFGYTGYPETFNYVRNSVKITMDAYTGDVVAYADDRDPIIQAYSKAFGGVFKKFGDMSTELSKHIRYPEDMFSIQTAVYTNYHMTDPQVYYNKGDVWAIPEAQQSGDRTAMEPYYVIMRLPGAKNEEFILLRPFIRAGKDNMVAWMCAKCDPADYGRLVLFEFPKGRLVSGPKQIEARANQNAEISRQLTLWGQIGSKVTWGNLLPIPIENSILFVQPLYLEASETAIPEFLRVIVSMGDQVVMEENLEAAIAAVTGGTPAPATVARKAPPAAGKAPTAVAPAPAPKSPVDAAVQQFKAAQDAQRRGDWAGYGEKLKQLEQTLQRLQRGSKQ